MRHVIASLCLLCALSGCADTPLADAPEPQVLVFTRTAGFRHASIPAGVAALDSLGRTHGIRITHSEDPTLFSDSGLAAFDAIVFLHTTGDILDEDQQAAMERWFGAGRGFVGVHAAADTEYDWAWYGGLVGAYFQSHPAIQLGALSVVNATHPSTETLPGTFTRVDEWYNFIAPPADGVQVLLTLDETSYVGGTMGAEHPIAWSHTYDGGRAWYTGMGHTEASFSEPLFLAHLLGGVRWAVGLE